MTADPCRQRARHFLAGEMTASEQETFLRHARTCETCDSLVRLDAELREAPPSAPLTALESNSVRVAVLRRLRSDRERRSTRRPRWALAASLAAAAVLLLAVGVAAGRLWARRTAGPNSETLTALITQAAIGSRTLAEIENSPYSFTNVAFRVVNDERVMVSFDVSRHLELTAHRSDPLVRQLVVQAVLNPSPVGSRLKAISYAEGIADRAVVDALRRAMLDDSSVAIRLRALAALAPRKTDPEVQSALLTVLATSDSVPLRLQAIDYLVEGRVDPQKMRAALATLDPVDDAAALVKASGYIR